MLQTSEDYYQRFMISSAIRWVRYLFLLISVLLPSLYVAVMTFHQEILPTTLMLRIASSREQVPFPALVEAFMMELTFEGLREARLRLPKQVGAAVSIVGALVIGQAAVERKGNQASRIARGRGEIRMTWGAIAGVSLIPIILVLYEWPQMKQTQRKAKAAFLTLTVAGWLLAIILLLFPDLPGPTQLIDWFFKPFSTFWKKFSGIGK